MPAPRRTPGRNRPRLPGEPPTLQELAKQVEELETKVKGQIRLEQLPIKDLQARLISSWDPDARELLLPGSVTSNMLGTTATAFPSFPFPYAGGWADYGGGFEGATYSRIGRLVVLQGLVTYTPGLPPAGTVIGTLPVGFRPSASLLFTTECNGVHLRIDVAANGNVIWQGTSPAPAVEPEYTTLSGITFHGR